MVFNLTARTLDRALDVDLQRRQRLELLAAASQQRLVGPARVDLGEHAERLQQQRAPGSELGAGAALELGPGQAQAGGGELVGEARGVPREPVGVELEVESIHACEARAGGVRRVRHARAPGACRMAHARLALGAQVEQDALRAARRARDADGPAVPDQQVRPLDPGGARHDPHEVALDALRSRSRS